MDNGRQPATKKDLLDLEQKFVEAIHDSETKLLRAFYSYAEAAQKHFNDLDRSDSSLRERLGTCETRITEIEKRLNKPRP